MPVPGSRAMQCGSASSCALASVFSVLGDSTYHPGSRVIRREGKHQVTVHWHGRRITTWGVVQRKTPDRAVPLSGSFADNVEIVAVEMDRMRQLERVGRFNVPDIPVAGRHFMDVVVRVVVALSSKRRLERGVVPVDNHRCAVQEPTDDIACAELEVDLASAADYRRRHGVGDERNDLGPVFIDAVCLQRDTSACRVFAGGTRV